MKKFIFMLTVLLIAFQANRAFSAEHNLGAGIYLGEPLGFTGKYFFDRENAVAFGIGDLHDDLYFWGDYLRHFYNVIPIENFPLYFGAGLGVHDYEHDNNKNREDEDEVRFEIRVPVGIEYLIQKVPLGAFLELVPALRIIPDVDFEFRAGIGIRYYF